MMGITKMNCWVLKDDTGTNILNIITLSHFAIIACITINCGQITLSDDDSHFTKLTNFNK